MRQRGSFLLDTKEKLLEIREKLDGRVLVGDGALGTLLADRGVDQPYSRANLTQASTIRAVHEEYLRAGARVIETNTFLANRLKRS
jgi:methionine synthase I (cobalamin-dependent)